MPVNQETMVSEGESSVDRYHVIGRALGGSDVYDSDGKLVGYATPSIIGDGEDFFDMNGKPVGQSFDDHHGGADFIGLGNDSYGYISREILMGKDAWVNGDPFGEIEDTGDFNGSTK